MACDLAMPGYDLHGKIIIHHMNPVTVEDIVHGDESILDPEYLVCVSQRTHNAIHYGDDNLPLDPYVERRPGDTRLW